MHEACQVRTRVIAGHAQCRTFVLCEEGHVPKKVQKAKNREEQVLAACTVRMNPYLHYRKMWGQIMHISAWEEERDTEANWLLLWRSCCARRVWIFSSPTLRRLELLKASGRKWGISSRSVASSQMRSSSRATKVVRCGQSRMQSLRSPWIGSKKSCWWVEPCRHPEKGQSAQDLAAKIASSGKWSGIPSTCEQGRPQRFS